MVKSRVSDLFAAFDTIRCTLLINIKDIGGCHCGTVYQALLSTLCTGFHPMGPFECYVTQMGVGGLNFSEKKRYEGVMSQI